MNNLSLPQKSSIRWTIFLLSSSCFLAIPAVLLFICLAMFFPQLNTSGLVVVSLLTAGFSWWIWNVRSQLLKGEKEAWYSATTIAFLCIPSILLPLALLSLKELLNAENQNAFGPSHSPRAPQPTSPATWSRGKIAFSAICAAVSLAALLAKIYPYWEKFGANANGSNFKVDANLSISQLKMLGAKCNSEGNMACALAVFQRIYSLDPSSVNALANIAMAETDLGRHEEAIKHFELYFSQGGQGVDAMLFMAKSLDARGNKTEALAWCQRILASNPNLIDVAQYKARLLYQLGRHGEATQFIDSYLEEYPSAKAYFEGLRRQIQSPNEKQARAETI